MNFFQIFSQYCPSSCQHVHLKTQQQVDNKPGSPSDPLTLLTSVSLGGRGTNGSPIIIFPEYPDFSDVKEEELQNVLSYLTSVPR